MPLSTTCHNISVTLLLSVLWIEVEKHASQTDNKPTILNAEIIFITLIYMYLDNFLWFMVHEIAYDMGLKVVVVNNMLVLINFLLQNTNLVSVLCKNLNRGGH
jgi:hypothetical protein